VEENREILFSTFVLLNISVVLRFIGSGMTITGYDVC